MKENTRKIKNLDFLELFKVNQLIRGGKQRIKHPMLMDVDFSKRRELEKNQSLFLNSIKKRFFNDDYKTLFDGNPDNYDLLYNSFMFFMWKNIIPHLHFLEMVGTQPREQENQLIFLMRAHYQLSPESEELLKNENDENIPDEFLQAFNFSIDKMTITGINIIDNIFGKIAPLFKDGIKIGYEETVFNKYPDFLKLLIIDIVDKMNSTFFETLKNIPSEIVNVKNNMQYWTTLHKHANFIAIEAKRGNGNVVLMSEELFNGICEIPGSDELLGNININSMDRTFRYIFLETSRYNLIIDTEMEGKEMIIGYRGDSEMDCGLFYSPTQNSLDIHVDENDNLNYNFSMDIFENTFGVKSYVKRIIFK